MSFHIVNIGGGGPLKNTGIGRGRHPDAGREFTDGDMETVSNIPFGVSVQIGVLR